MILRLSMILLAFGVAACAPATNTAVERQALGIQGTCLLYTSPSPRDS